MPSQNYFNLTLFYIISCFHKEILTLFFFEKFSFFGVVLVIRGQDSVQKPVCCGDFTLDFSNPYSQPSCYKNAFPSQPYPDYIVDMCICNAELVYDVCTDTCVNPDDCPSPDQLVRCRGENGVPNAFQDRCDSP